MNGLSRRRLSALLAAVWFLLPALLSAQDAAAGPWAELLALDGLKPETAQMPTAKLRGMGRFPRRTFNQVWDDWTCLDRTALQAGKTFLAASGSAAALLAAAAAYDDVPGLPPSPPEAPDARPGASQLVDAIAALHVLNSRPLDAARHRQLADAAAKVPDAVARQAARLLRAVPDAVAARNRAFAAVAAPEQMQPMFKHALNLASHYTVRPDTRKLIEKTDYRQLFSGAMHLACAIDAVLKTPPPPEAKKPFAFRWNTPLGAVVLNGTANDTYAPADYLLIIDVGGNDSYRDGATTTNDAAHPVSLLLDWSGNDSYRSDEIAFATGILGYAFLIDAAGDDTYRAPGGVAAAAAGTGMLLDLGGNDSYHVADYGIAAATLGLAVLNDVSGHDSYYCVQAGQALAKTIGCAALVDAAGNDRYVAEDQKIVCPSPQSAKHNASVSQGCGFGRRAHPGDGYSLAGGVAVIAEGAGNDSYSGGVFSQGVGYWYALGMVVDFGGNDSYLGPWYSQGASAHYAVGALLDLGGDDSYRLTMNQGQGHGRDYSTGLLHDLGGNDVFQGPNNALGNANMNGIGLFRKQGGAAEFKCPGRTLGSTGDARPQHLCLGLFLAEDGRFTLPPDPQAQLNRSWVRPKKDKRPLCHGIGLVRNASGSAPAPAPGSQQP